MKATLFFLFCGLSVLSAAAQTITPTVPVPPAMSDSTDRVGSPSVRRMGTGFYLRPGDPPNVMRANLDNMPVKTTDPNRPQPALFHAEPAVTQLVPLLVAVAGQFKIASAPTALELSYRDIPYLEDTVYLVYQLCQRLFQILNQVFGVFQADGDAEQVGGRFAGQAFYARPVFDQAFDTAHTGRAGK